MNEITMYCDGGCRGNQSKENIGAWGYTLEFNGITKEDSGAVRNTTNNKMELQAVIEGLKAIKKKEYTVNVHVDSNYLLQGITTWIHNWKKKGWRKADKKPVENKELWIELDTLRNEFQNVNFIKVKGHSGEEGNERVDQLCNEAMDQIQ